MPQFKKVQKSITIEINDHDLANVNLILSAQAKYSLALTLCGIGVGFDCDDVMFASLPYGKTCPARYVGEGVVSM